jgi:L-ascorbate metabolism protein UlaG (beta-lactamase superfamily)
MRHSPLWDGDGFRNVQPILPGLRDPQASMPSLTEVLLRTGTRRAPARPLPSVSPVQGWRHAPGSGLRATWLGHSTVLIEIDGVRVLTDPVWGPRASPFTLAGPKRFQPVPVALGAMPPMDLVIISHDHYDHLDYPTIRALTHSAVPFVTSLGVGAHLEAWGVPPQRITELDWWEHHDLPGSGVRVSAAPAQHFSGRTPKTRNSTLWSSFIVQTERHCVFFSGDTGLTRQYQRIRERFGPFDLAMLEIGGWHAAWGDMHLGPDHALEAVALLGAEVWLPVHWGTFSLAMHAWDQPAERLLELSATSRARLMMPRIGEPVEPQEASGRVEPWWRGVEGVEGPGPGGGRRDALERHASADGLRIP